MNISKKQLEFIEYVEKCGYVFLGEVEFSKYPQSMIESLLRKGLLFECEGKLASTTKKI